MTGQRRKEKIAAGALLVCIVLVSAWLLASGIARSGNPEGTVSGLSFLGFSPTLEAWWAEEQQVSSDPLEPNILAYALRRRYPDNTAQHSGVAVRIVHGYNMRDCMRIKGYEVDLIEDRRQQTVDHRPETADRRRQADPASRISDPASHVSPSLTNNCYTDNALPPYQLWRLTSSTGDISIWVTSMIRATDLTATGIDTRDMAFPRVGIPDAQGWAPRGLSWEGLRHPIKNTRLFLRSKWNASRCDLLTFLGLRRPAWVSQELLTIVSVCRVPSKKESGEADVISHVLRGHTGMLLELRRWGEERRE